MLVADLRVDTGVGSYVMCKIVLNSGSEATPTRRESGGSVIVERKWDISGFHELDASITVTRFNTSRSGFRGLQRAYPGLYGTIALKSGVGLMHRSSKSPWLLSCTVVDCES